MSVLIVENHLAASYNQSLLRMCELFSLIFEEFVILLKYLEVSACHHTIGHAVNLDAAIKDHEIDSN